MLRAEEFWVGLGTRLLYSGFGIFLLKIGGAALSSSSLKLGKELGLRWALLVGLPEGTFKVALFVLLELSLVMGLLLTALELLFLEQNFQACGYNP